MVLKKETTLFARDNDENIIPLEVTLVIDEEDVYQNKLKGEKIIITPMGRGELKKLFSDVQIRTEKLLEELRKKDENKDKKDIDLKPEIDDDDLSLDVQIITSYCKQPSYTEKEVKDLKPGVRQAIVNTILFESGLDTSKPKRKAVNDKEDEFSKN